jgi:hypothetical protein
MRVGVIGGCIARERIESNKLGGFIIFTVWQLQPGEFTHSSLFRAKIFFWQVNILNVWNSILEYKWGCVQMIPTYFRLLYSPLFKFNCRPISFYIWLQVNLPNGSSYTILSLHLFPTTIWIRVERWMNMYERWWWFYMEEQIEKQNRLEEGGANCQ